MAITIGITGGIGSGKSTVCKIFKLLEIPVFEADRVAKNLINSNSKIKKELINLFGSDIYTANELVNRKKLAEIIFNDDIQLAKINKLVHPVVREEFIKWEKRQKTKYVIHEAAILFESGFYKIMDFTILVSTRKNERIKRVMKRDNISKKLVLERMKKQWSDEKKRQLATIEINNNNENLIIPEIIKTDKQLKEYGKIW
jgi:dephospho-CoA kinase